MKIIIYGTSKEFEDFIKGTQIIYNPKFEFKFIDKQQMIKKVSMWVACVIALFLWLLFV